MGINTGLVATGGETEAEDTIMGRAVNLAARLESAAPAGGLLISHHTYRHVRGVFNVEPREPIRAKGFDKPLDVYLVSRAKPRAFHVLTRGVEGVETRMVGRETELKYLKDALLTAMEEGEGQVVTITGDAGVGKSRLIYEFQNWLELLPQGVRLFPGQARQETQHISLSLLRDVYAYRFQIYDSDPVEVVRDKFIRGVGETFDSQTASVDRGNLSNEGQVHILEQLLGFDFSHSPHLEGFLKDAKTLYNRGLLALENYFTALCKQGSVVVLLEDVHWADTRTLDAIQRLGKMTQHLPLLIVCLARQQPYEKRPYWGEGEHYNTRLDLRPLSKRESRQLVGEILQYIDQVPVELRELVVNGAEGNPFYIEELIKMLIEKGVIITGEADTEGIERWRVVDDRLAQVDLPATLAGVLQARLDSLGVKEKVILQQASVVGRTFWDRLVEHLSMTENGEQSGKELKQVLGELRDKEMIFRREKLAITGDVEYTFKHDVLREVIYETVLVKDRRRYHGLVADWLLKNSGERLEEYYGLIGEHLEKAGSKEEAIETFLKAGERSLGSYANEEAKGYFLRALDLGARDRLKAELFTGLGRALVRQGQHDEALKSWQDGIHIYKILGDRESMLEIYTRAIRWSLPLHPREAIRLSLESLEIIDGREEGILFAKLCSQVGRAYFFNGNEKQSLQYCQRALRLGEDLGDVGVQADALATIGVLSTLPFEQRLEKLQKALNLAEANHLLYTLKRALNNIGDVYSLLGDIQAALHSMNRSIELARLWGDHEGELFALIQAANENLIIGELEIAKDLLDQVATRLEAQPDLEGIHIMLELRRAIYLWQKGNLVLALQTAKRVLEKSLQLGLKDNWYFCVEMVYVPVILDIDQFLEAPDWSEAEDIVVEAYELTKKGGPYHHGFENLHPLMSKLCSRQGKLIQAVSWLERVKKLLGDYPPYIIRKNIGMAEVELAIAQRNWTKAMEGFANYVDLVKEAGQRWEIARAYLDWRDVCVARGEAGDLERAKELYHQSLEMFTQMGADGYVKVVHERIAALKKEGGISRAYRTDLNQMFSWLISIY